MYAPLSSCHVPSARVCAPLHPHGHCPPQAPALPEHPPQNTCGGAALSWWTWTATPAGRSVLPIVATAVLRRRRRRARRRAGVQAARRCPSPSAALTMSTARQPRVMVCSSPICRLCRARPCICGSGVRRGRAACACRQGGARPLSRRPEIGCPAPHPLQGSPLQLLFVGVPAPPRWVPGERPPQRVALRSGSENHGSRTSIATGTASALRGRTSRNTSCGAAPPVGGSRKRSEIRPKKPALVRERACGTGATRPLRRRCRCCRR